MSYLVLIFGFLILLAGIVLVVRPSALFSLLQRYENTRVLYALAIGVRILLGGVLILAAPSSRLPLVLTAIGWVAIGAAIFIGVRGRTRFSKLMASILRLSDSWGRGAGVFTVLFGGVLVYAVR